MNIILITIFTILIRKYQNNKKEKNIKYLLYDYS